MNLQRPYRFAIPAPKEWRAVAVAGAVIAITIGILKHHDDIAELAVRIGFPITMLAGFLGSEQTRARRIAAWSIMLSGLALFALGAYLQGGA